MFHGMFLRIRSIVHFWVLFTLLVFLNIVSQDGESKMEVIDRSTFRVSDTVTGS